MTDWYPGRLSGFPEASTPELDRYFCHFHGGSPSQVPPHLLNCPEGQACEFGPFMDVAGAVATFGGPAGLPEPEAGS